MIEILIENLMEIVTALFMALIGIAGTWLTAKIGKHKELVNIRIATDMLKSAAVDTAKELQQTTVDNLKAASADGKLTAEEIKALGAALIAKTLDKMDEPAKKLLNAAGVDISAIIHGAAESWISEMRW